MLQNKIWGGKIATSNVVSTTACSGGANPAELREVGWLGVGLSIMDLSGSWVLITSFFLWLRLDWIQWGQAKWRGGQGLLWLVQGRGLSVKFHGPLGLKACSTGRLVLHCLGFHEKCVYYALNMLCCGWWFVNDLSCCVCFKVFYSKNLIYRVLDTDEWNLYCSLHWPAPGGPGVGLRPRAA
jgi:hypothetical protein